MTKLLFAILVCPLFALAQHAAPRFENDTLYTSSGFKIYPGQTLQFGKGTGKNGTFRFIIFRSGTTSSSLQNASILVKELKNFEISAWANGYSLLELATYGFGNRFIEITGTINYKDGSKGYVDIKMAFDKAIENFPDIPSELIVPAEFRKNEITSVSEGIKKLYTLYNNDVINKEQFETQKNKLLLRSLQSPLSSPVQYIVPRFENDTLYTTSGYKIYKGQILQFGEGTGENGKFRFINIKNAANRDSVANKKIVVEGLKNFGISALGNYYITIVSILNYKDGSKGILNLHTAFDNAIENSPELPSELIVPAEFRNKEAVRVAYEINDLDQLYKAGALTKEEFEAQKKKLLGQ